MLSLFIESGTYLRARRKITFALCCRPPGPLPQPEGARRRAGICGVAAPRRWRRASDAPHRLRRGALHLPARRSRQNVNVILRQALSPSSATSLFDIGSLVPAQIRCSSPGSTMRRYGTSFFCIGPECFSGPGINPLGAISPGQSGQHGTPALNSPELQQRRCLPLLTQIQQGRAERYRKANPR